MATIRDFDLGGVTAQAENIQKSRQQRKLSDILRPLQAQQAQQKTDQGALQTNKLQVDAGIREAGILVGAFGQVDQDPLVNQQKWDNAKAVLASTGVDTSDLSPQFDPNNFQAIQGAAQSGGQQLKSSGQREFESLIADFTPEQQKFAREVEARIVAAPVGSAATTIAKAGDTGIVAESQATIEGSKAKSRAIGKAEGEFQAAPLIAQARAQIETAIGVARKESAARGDASSELAEMKASLPGLKGVVDQLKELSTVATSTLGGRVFDVAVKELGFGSTEGATARAKFIAVVNNQVLPLLKATFGGSFSIQEGAELKASMGDPNASPAEKIAQLDAFINAKVREIENKERLLNQNQESPSDNGSAADRLRALEQELGI